MVSRIPPVLLGVAVRNVWLRLNSQTFAEIERSRLEPRAHPLFLKEENPERKRRRVGEIGGYVSSRTALGAWQVGWCRNIGKRSGLVESFLPTHSVFHRKFQVPSSWRRQDCIHHVGVALSAASPGVAPSQLIHVEIISLHNSGMHGVYGRSCFGL